MTTTTHQQAPAPTSGYNLTISFGLISIPVKYSQSREDKAVGVKRSMFTVDGHPVGAMSYDKQTGAKVEKADVVYRADVDGVWVDVTDEEIATYTHDETLLAGVGAIDTFVPLAAIGTEYRVLDTYYVQAAPNGSGKNKTANPAAEKALGLLTSTMALREVAALFRLPTSRGIAKWAALLPDGRMVTLLFASEVRAAFPRPEPTATPAEEALALQLIDSIGVSTPVLDDEATPALRTYLEAKAAGKRPEAPAAATITADVLDLEAALAASLGEKVA